MENKTSVVVSETDRQILALLQKDANLSVAEIAEQVGLSQSPCWRRISRLEQEGVIRNRVALLDPSRLGLGVTIFVNVRLSAHQNQSLLDFEKAICAFPEVMECYTTTGTMDFLLKIMTRDIHSYETFFRDHLSQMAAVQEVHSSIAITQLKYTTQMPLDFI